MKHALAIGLVFAAFVTGALATPVQRALGEPETGPPMPYEDIGACPFEGCVYREWVANAPVTVRTGRRTSDPVAFTLQAGEHVQAVTGVVVTLKPGRVMFRAPIDLPSTQGAVHVEPGDTLYLLTYRGEGETTAWFKGQLYETLDGSEFFNGLCELRPNECNGTIVERPERVWWVRLRQLKGLYGWSSEPDTFDNKDSRG